MTCTAPLTAYQTPGGAVTFKRENYHQQELQLPCGQCMDCRLERGRQWAVRIMHEAHLHEWNWFATLTYDQEHLPRDLQPIHFTNFMKRLRHHIPTARYYACGEYGDKTKRPHYHAALFDLPLTDLKHYSGTNQNRLFTSDLVNKKWGHGQVLLGMLTFESAMYVASYVTKKITGKAASSHYLALDEATGELYERQPEFARMSLKPAIGKRWIEKYTQDVYNYDHVIVNGREQKAPRYYDKYYNGQDPEKMEKLKQERRKQAQEHKHDNTRERLETKAKITAARLKLKRRTI